MSTSDNCKDGASTKCSTSKSSNDGANVCDVKIKLQNMSTADDSISICANCGKEGDDINNICNKCKKTTYCNASCKKKHRHKHKKECEEYLRLAAERAAELHDIELFKQPPPPEEDCPICFQRLPTLKTGCQYYACCGKVICSGCIHAPLYDNQGNEVDNKKCPFCRTPHPKTNEEMMERTTKRVEMNDPIAIYNLGVCYRDGMYGYPVDHTKELELYHRAGEIGYANAYNNIGYAYNNGKGVNVDKKKGLHYYEIAAMKGDVYARHNLAINEARAGNVNRALKHHMIAVVGGDGDSLKRIKKMYNGRQATKDDYTAALRTYQAYLSEIKSPQRDKASSVGEEYRYY